MKTQDATHLIAQAAQDACKVISEAAQQAKLVMAAEKKSENGTNKLQDFLYKQVSLTVSVIAVALGAFIYLTNPAKDNNTALQLQDQRITSQRTTIDDLTKTAQNDTKELKNEVTGLRQEVQTMSNKITELSTIISERIPKVK